MKKSTIYLIGFMGSGKSTISGELAKGLGLPAKEMDEILTETFGKPITQVFAQEGEEAFRQAETALIERIGQEPCVVSCGGGVAMREENVRLMRENGQVVYLSAKPETIYERVKTDTHRPLLNGHMNVEYILELMEKRQPFYQAAADITIEVDHKTVAQIVWEIREALD